MSNSNKNIICTTLLVEKSPQALPLGAACIASAIKHDSLTKDWTHVELVAQSMEDSSFLQASGEGKDPDKAAVYISEKLLSYKPDLVCFSVFVWNRTILEKTALILKEKDVITLAGGPEVTAHPEVMTAFDYVATGEGEVKVPYIIASKIFPEEIKGNKNIQLPQESQNTSCKLETLNSPYLDGTINPTEYGGALWELARGCPFKCSYCYESKGEKTVRMFPMERIEKELDLFAKQQTPQVFVLDPTYNANKKRALELLNLIAKKTPDTFYYFEARAEFIDRQMAQAFTKIPCAVQFGLQSADEQVLKLVHRPFNKKQFVKNIGFMNEAGVTFGFDLIYGLPGESLKGFKEGIDFAMSLYPNNLELFCLSVLPGTDLFDRAEELHLTYEKEPPYHVIHTDRYSQADIQAADKISQACTFFYNEGRAVPWFNTICRSLHLRSSQFFVQFAQQYPEATCNKIKDHMEIQKYQIDFITKLYKERHLEKYIKAATDIIVFNGALSRTQDTGKKEVLKLNYDCEYLASEYATDLQFFVQNVKPKPNTTETFRKGKFADFRRIK